jgi:hypothetical protein
MATTSSPTASDDDDPRVAVGSPEASSIRRQRQVGGLVGTDERGGAGLRLPGEGDVDRRRAVDDVRVGQHLAVRREDDAGAGPAAGSAEAAADPV